MNIFHRLLKDKRGAVLAYTFMLIIVIAVALSSIFIKLAYTGQFANMRTEDQQLHLYAQSALGAITEKFLIEDSEESELLKDYFKDIKNTNTPVTGEFTYSGNSNLKFLASIDQYDDDHAIITVTATDTTTGGEEKASRIVAVDASERNSIFDNMFIIYHPDRTDGILGDGAAHAKIFNGGMMIDNKARMPIERSTFSNEEWEGFTNQLESGEYIPKYIGIDDDHTTDEDDIYKDTDAINFQVLTDPGKETTFGSIIANGAVNIGSSGTAATINFDENAMISVPVGKVSINNVVLKGGLSLIAAAGKDPNDASMPTDSNYTGMQISDVKFETDNTVDIVTRDNGNINFTNVTGDTVGNVYAGGEFKAENGDATIEGIYGYKKITLNDVNYVIKNNIYSNSEFKSTGGNVQVATEYVDSTGDEPGIYGADNVTFDSGHVFGYVLAGGKLTIGSGATVDEDVLAGGNFLKSESNRRYDIDGTVLGEKIQTGDDSGFSFDKFKELNAIWRKGVLFCNKGGFDGTSGRADATKANILVALTDMSDETIEGFPYKFDDLDDALEKHNDMQELPDTDPEYSKTGLQNEDWVLEKDDDRKAGDEEVYVTASMRYTTDDGRLLIRNDICDWIGGPTNSYDTNFYSEGTIMTLFNDAISTDGIPPKVVDQVSRHYTYAELMYVSDTEYRVTRGGKIDVGNQAQDNVIRADFGTGAVEEVVVPNGVKLTFDTTQASGQSFDIYVDALDTTTNNIMFPWTVEIKYDPVAYATAKSEDYVDDSGVSWKAAGEENYVAFYLDGTDTIEFKNDTSTAGVVGVPSSYEADGSIPTTNYEYVTKKNADGSCEYAVRSYMSMPEFYVLSARESYTTLTSADRSRIGEGNMKSTDTVKINGYDFNGFIVAPRAYVSFTDAAVTNAVSSDGKTSSLSSAEAYRGVIMCKDLKLAAYNNAEYNYYFPLSFHNVLNDDNFVMYTRKTGSN